MHIADKPRLLWDSSPFLILAVGAAISTRSCYLNLGCQVLYELEARLSEEQAWSQFSSHTVVTMVAEIIEVVWQ